MAQTNKIPANPKSPSFDVEKAQNIIFQPNPGPQTEFLAASEQEVLYGGAAGGGKSFAMLADPLRGMNDPNFSGLLLRRTNDELRDLKNTSKQLYPKAIPGIKWSEKDSTWYTPQGASLWMTYLDRDDDVTRFQGQQYSWIGFDELTQWPSPYPWDYLRSRLRSASGLSLYQRATTNPGGRGHAWVKKMFIDPAPPGKAFWGTDITTGEPLKYPDNHSKFPGHFVVKRRFIPAKLYDNPYLSEDGAYEANLLSLPEFQRKQLLEGSWDIVDGAAFAEFNRLLHVIEPFEIPNNWPRFRAADYGYSDASCVLWFAVSPSEQLIIYREFYQRGVLAEDLGLKIVQAEEEDRTRVRYGVLDSSTWANRGDRGPSIAEQINGVLRDYNHKVFRPSDRSKGSRVAGKNEIHRRLKVNEFTEEPGLVIFNTCRELITQLPAIPLDRNNPEDVDTHSEDHAYDALRYGVMTRPKSSVWDHTAPKSDGFAAFDKTFGY